MSEGEKQSQRAFVLGLDGVPWGKLTGWIDDGYLPNFRRLRASGAGGPLESTMPPTTALAWPSISTGVWPDKHGVYGFQRLKSDYTHDLNTRNEVTAPALWEQVSPSIVANVPMTYPAPPIDGEIVTGMLTPEQNSRFTHPPELRHEIRETVPDYEIGLSWNEYGGRLDEFEEDLQNLLENRRELMRLLMNREEWRLFYFVYTAPDRLQHLLWEEDVLIEHYQYLDEIVGEAMNYAEDRDATLFVLSDHGFGPVEKHIAVNSVLEREGYLARREPDGIRSVLTNVGVSKSGIRSVLERLGISEATLVDRLPTRLVNTVAERVPGSHSLYDVDFSRTEAFVHGNGCVYVNDDERFEDGIVDLTDRPRIKAELRDVFETVTDPEDGATILSVYDGDELFETDDRSPDLIIRGADEYTKVTELKDDLIAPFEVRDASHRRDGIFFAWGPHIDADASVEDASVVDFAPTVLQALGEPIPTDVDGRCLEEIYLDDVEATERVVTTRASSSPSRDDDFGDVEDRLRGLGYMD